MTITGDARTQTGARRGKETGEVRRAKDTKIAEARRRAAVRATKSHDGADKSRSDTRDGKRDRVAVTLPSRRSLKSSSLSGGCKQKVGGDIQYRTRNQKRQQQALCSTRATNSREPTRRKRHATARHGAQQTARRPSKHLLLAVLDLAKERHELLHLRCHRANAQTGKLRPSQNEGQRLKLRDMRASTTATTATRKRCETIGATRTGGGRK